VSTADFLTGAFTFGVLLACAAISASVIVSRRGGADLTGAARVTAWLTLAVGFVFVAHLFPGMLGGLSSTSVTVTAAMLLALSLSVPERLYRPDVEAQPIPRDTPDWVRWVGWSALGLVAVYVVGWMSAHGGVYLSQQDVVSFHLPNVVAWIQEGSLWGIHDWIPNRAPGNYPQTGDVYMLATILPWDSDFLVRFAGLPFLGLAGAAIYAAGGEVGAPRGVAALSAAAVLAMPAVSYIALNGLADPEMVGAFAAGGFFLLRHWRTGDGFDLALAGLGLGLAFGSRWYAVPAVAIVVGVWLLGRVVTPARRRGFWRDAGVLVGIVALVGGFWLLRNWIESANPVFPVEVSPLGISLFDAPRDEFRDLYGFTLAHYLTDFDVLGEYIWPRFLDILTFTAVALWGGVVAAGVVAWRRREPLSGRVIALSVSALLILAVYLGTPYTAFGEEGVPFEAWVNSRYVVPAFLCAAPALAWLIGRSRGLTVVGVPILGLLILDALRRAIDDDVLAQASLPLKDAVVGAVVVGLAVAVGFAWRRLSASGLSSRTRFALALAAAGAVGLVVAFAQENRFTEDRYEGIGPDATYINETAPTGNKVGLLGDGFVSYHLFGPRLGNELTYIGRREREMLRPLDRFGPFRRAVRRGDYDLIAWRSLDTLEAELPTQQARWLEEMGWTRTAEGVNTLLNSDVAIYLPPENKDANEDAADPELPAATG
jgi:hypothetical protein